MLNNLVKGQITEMKCFIKCAELGIVVSKPMFDNARYDFILEKDGKCYRVQVKTSRAVDNFGIRWNGYSQHATQNGNKRMIYTDKDIDFFMTVFEDVAYLVPCTGKQEYTIRTKNVYNQPTVIMAQDYEFDKMITQL